MAPQFHHICLGATTFNQNVSFYFKELANPFQPSRKGIDLFKKRLDVMEWSTVASSNLWCICKSLTESTTDLLTFFRSRSLFISAWLVPNLNIYCAKPQSPSPENIPHIVSPVATWALRRLLNMVGSWCRPCPAWWGKSSCHQAGDDLDGVCLFSKSSSRWPSPSHSSRSRGLSTSPGYFIY